MKLNKKIAIQLSVVVTSVLFVSVLLASLYALRAFNSAVLQTGSETAEILSDSYATRITAHVNKAIFVGEQTANTLIPFRERATDDGSFLENTKIALHAAAQMSPDVASIYFQAEGKETQTLDSLNILGVEQNDYVHIAHRQNGYEDAPKDANFRISNEELNYVRKTGNTYISEPFFIRYAENDVVAVTIIAPVQNGNRFYGAVGINYLLTDIDDLMNKPFGKLTGTKLVLLSDTKTIVYISGKKWVSTKNIEDYTGDERQLYRLSERPEVLADELNVSYSKRIITLSANTSWEFHSFIPQEVIVKNLLQNVTQIVIIVSLIVLLGAAFIVYFIFRKLQTIKQIKRNAEFLTKGKTLAVVPHNAGDETDEILSLLDEIQQNTQNTEARLRLLCNDNLEAYHQPAETELEKLTEILRNKLIETKDTIMSEKETAEIQLWSRKGRFDVANAQMISPHNINELTNNVLRTVMQYAGASVAGLYFHYKKAQPPYLQPIAAFAYNDIKHLRRKFSLGESLVGTCAQERKVIVRDNLPENYLDIATGLNTLPPTFLYLTPIIYQNDLLAVCEYIFLKKPKSHVLDFIEQLSINIGGWLDTAINSTESRKLLDASQQNAHLLEDKEKELSTHVAQLEFFQAENQKNTVRMQAILNALNHTVMRVEYTVSGVFMDANELYLNTMGFDLKQLSGRNVMDIAKENRDELKDFMTRIKKGESFEGKVVRKTSLGESKTLFASYTPYINAEGKIEKVIFLAIDLALANKV